MTKETNKFHALQLFTDTFTAETVHLTNEAIGIYIRLLSFAWTKNAKPFTTENAYRICQCKTDDCCINVYEVLQEFFILNTEDKENRNKNTWTQKRLVHEHAYLTDKYQRKSEAGKKGMQIRYDSVNNKTITPIPNPIPIPNKIYNDQFENIWKNLKIKRGSKYKAYKEFNKINVEEITDKQIITIYNAQIKCIEDKKYMPHFSTWLFQRRWEIEDDINVIPDLIDRLVNLGYTHKGTDGNFELFKKDGKSYRIDKFDEKHQIQLDQ
jgi:uncharacterized protein YdaU (DUF1376 family)